MCVQGDRITKISVGVEELENKSKLFFLFPREMNQVG